MGRILAIHRQEGFLELVRRALAGLQDVETTELSRFAIHHLAVPGAYEAVLCDAQDPARAQAVFEKITQSCPDAHLIPVVGDAEEAARFHQAWKPAGRGAGKFDLDQSSWLPERCTVGQILALLGAREETKAADELISESKPETTEPPLIPDSRIDGYRLVCKIGEGGFGASWLAVNEATGKHVAMKFVEGDEQFQQELSALRKYVHVADCDKHLIRPEHINCSGSRLWVVTPLADSMTGSHSSDAYQPLSLANQLAARGHLPESEAVSVAICLVRALAALHHHGLLHGDVAPSNILSIHGRWVLADPGLVRFVGQHGICRNRLYYPQAASIRPGDDLYAVGIILWEMTSGAWEMISGRERMRLDPPMLKYLSRKELPLLKLICRAAAENPETRYLNAEEMLADLEVVANSLAQDADSKYRLYTLLRSLRAGGEPMKGQ